jgi:hypothetical protein
LRIRSAPQTRSNICVAAREAKKGECGFHSYFVVA